VEQQQTDGDIATKLNTQAAKELENNAYIFKAVLHQLEFLGRTNTAI